jgi:peroxiredoxin
MGYGKRSLLICLLSTLVLCLGAHAQETKVEVTYAGIELLENDRGWKVENDSRLTNSPLEIGDLILSVGGQGVAQIGPISIVALLEYAQFRYLGVVVERGGQEKEIFFRSLARGADGSSRERSALGATFRSVEDTERILVTDIVSGSPTDRAGLKVDDEILAVGGRAVAEMKLDQLADLLSTPRESDEHLRVRRGSHEVDIVLKPIYLEQSAKSPVAPKIPFPLHIRGERAPDFSLPDLQGRTVALNSFRGKPVLVTFWGTWCHLCIAEADLFDKLQRELGDRLTILALDVGDDPEELQHFLKIRPLSYPILVTGDLLSPVLKAYDMAGTLPLTLVIDPDGFVVYLQKGFSPASPLESQVHSLVAKSIRN